MVAFLEKSTGSDGFHQVIDFLTQSYICYALTKKPEVCVSFIRQFWRSAATSTDDNGEVNINATIDGHSLSITEGSLRRHLKLSDQDGITYIPNSEIFEQLALMEYHTDSDNPKKTACEQFSSNIPLLLLMFMLPIGARDKVVLSDDEDLAGDSSKQGRKLSDAEVQEKASNETKPVIQDVTPTEVIQDQESSEKGSVEVSTARAKQGTASEVPIVSTAEVNLSTAGGTVTYTRRSAEKKVRKTREKLMIESEPRRNIKKELEQERLSFAEAIRLEEQMNEEQRAQIARDEEIARQWDEEERKRACCSYSLLRKINWMIFSHNGFLSLRCKPKTVAQARRNMIKYLKNQGNLQIQ
ncbi:hypothetical protein Tco_0780404 [Tanacetum coccineum]